MADSKISALTAVSAVAAANEFAVNESGTSKKATAAQIGDYLFTRIAGSSGAAGEYKTLQALSANAAKSATTVLATVMTTTNVGIGVWKFDYDVIYQSQATTTGVDFAINHTGTVSDVLITELFITSGGAAASGLADQVTNNTANVAEGKAGRALNTKLGSSLGVDTINANCHAKIFGVVAVTGSGNLELKHCSEVSATSGVMAYTSLQLTRIA